MSEWIHTTLGKFIGLQRGHDLPSGQRVSGTVPVVGSGGVTGWHNEPKVSGPGITIGRAANLGMPTLVEQDFWPLNTTLYVTDFRDNNVRFTYYLFRILDLAGFNSGSVQPMLNRNYISSFPIQIPKRSEQDAIATVLGALDDKIAVNERIASTALELCLAIYAGEASSAEWESTSLGETARWYSGGTPNTGVPEYWGGEIPWISASSLKSPWIRDSDRRVTELGSRSGTRIVSPDTILFVVRGMSLTTEFRVGITRREVAFGQDCKALVANSGNDPKTLFLAIKFREREILNMVDLAGHGTGRLVTDRLASLPVQLPKSADSARDFSKLVNPLIDRACATGLENQALAALRDTLLPQLMSGRLRVRDAEKIVEDAT
ncbi:restriction endonuclease subunit S [Streptomyces griseoruber]|uniref:restriction endonuclease subunit S n=1 Tax=Streptomyces griseoruber TaxID=1943 RepID=UPI00378D7347